ncbi:hypothetical protein [Brevundimonas intermedia]|nr:hypothetical protein [Brevundimonas intermedia]
MGVVMGVQFDALGRPAGDPQADAETAGLDRSRGRAEEIARRQMGLAHE